MKNPIDQIETNKLDIKNIKITLDIMIKSILSFIGHSDKLEEFSKVYANTYSIQTGISYYDNKSIGTPYLTKYLRDGTQKQWSLKININENDDVDKDANKFIKKEKEDRYDKDNT